MIEELVEAVHRIASERRQLKAAIHDWVAATDALDACEDDANHGRCSCVHETRLHAAESALRSLA